MDKKKVGAFLKELRKEKQLTQEEFAREFSKSCFRDIGLVSDATISKWERGESLPNIEDIQRLAHFYKVTIDEILNGEKVADIDFDKKYFISDDHWYQNFSDNDNLYEIREKQELEIETRFKILLKKMISEGLTLTENVEADYLLTNFYTIYTEDDADDISIFIKNTKFQIIKMTSLMHNSSLDEKFWEAYKLFESYFMQTIKTDVSDAIDDAEHLLHERINNLEPFEKDMLLATIQVENVTHRYGIQDRNQAKFSGKLMHLYEKMYNRPYDEERLTKNAIRLLVECGARLNPLLLGYQSNKVIKIDILDRLIELYDKFKKPIIIPVLEERVYSFYEVENTSANRKEWGCDNCDEIFDAAEYSDLERRLYNGESVLEREVPEWIGGRNEDEMINYMFSVINELPLKDYLSARNERLTNELLRQLEKLPLKDIRQKYFTRSQNS